MIYLIAVIVSVLAFAIGYCIAGLEGAITVMCVLAILSNVAAAVMLFR